MLEFETSSGNMYAWDNEVGLFIPYSSTMRAVMNELLSENPLSRENAVEKLKEKFSEDEVAFCYDWLKKWGKLRPRNPKSQIHKKLNILDIKNYLKRRGITQLTLCVTEDCNFRCKYCAYSDFYEYTRGYSNKYMNFIVAKKAIDYFFSLLNETKAHNPIRKPLIGFYGGEPLLNFKLIKECVEYIISEYNDYEIMWTITTNGSLLTKEKSDWLMKHNFVIHVSLDGPEEEHNRLRVYKNGNGTFKDIMKNIDPMMKAGYKYIYSLPVFDWKCDFFKREEFFNRYDVPPVVGASPVTKSEGCRYYDQFTKEDYLIYLKEIERARKYYFENFGYQRQAGSFLYQLVGLPLQNNLIAGLAVYRRTELMPFTGACIPGRKIFVDVNGNYHICEKINGDFSIGNVDEGLSIESIFRFMSDYISCMDKCPDCEASRICGNCYQNSAIDEGFVCSSKICQKIESRTRDSFIKTFEIAELYPEFVESINYINKKIQKYYGE